MLQLRQPRPSKQTRPDDLAGVIVFGKEPRVESPPPPSEPNLMGVESTDRRREHRPGRRDEAGPGHLPRGHRPADRRSSPTATRTAANRSSRRSPPRRWTCRSTSCRSTTATTARSWSRRSSLPPDVKKGETVNINVVVRASEPTRGTLADLPEGRQLPGARGRQREARRRSSCSAGVNVFTLKQTITEPNFYTFTAEFIPDERQRRPPGRSTTWPRASRTPEARRSVLLIEGTAGEHAELVQALREKEIEVKTLVAPRIDGTGGVGGDPLPTDLARASAVRRVILGNVPKDAFTDEPAGAARPRTSTTWARA